MKTKLSQNNLKERKKMIREVCTETDGMTKMTKTPTKMAKMTKKTKQSLSLKKSTKLNAHIHLTPADFVAELVVDFL